MANRILIFLVIITLVFGAGFARTRTSEIVPEAGSISIDGSCLGRNADEYLEELGFEQGTDYLLYEGASTYVQILEPKEYLGKEFAVMITYPVVSGENDYLDHRIDSLMYAKEVKADMAAQEVSECFQALIEDYGSPAEIWTEIRTSSDDGSSTRLEDLDGFFFTEQEIEALWEDNDKDDCSLKARWYLPEENSIMDPDFIGLLEEFRGEVPDYCVTAEAEKTEEGILRLRISHTP